MSYVLLILEENINAYKIESNKLLKKFLNSREIDPTVVYPPSKWNHMSQDWLNITSGFRSQCTHSFASWTLYNKILSLLDHEEHEVLKYSTLYNKFIYEFSQLTYSIMDELSYFPGPYSVEDLERFEIICIDAFCQFWTGRKVMQLLYENPEELDNIDDQMREYTYDFYSIFV